MSSVWMTNRRREYKCASGKYLGRNRIIPICICQTKASTSRFGGARPLPDDRWENYARITENDVLYWLRFRHDEPGMQYDYIGNQVLITNHVDVVDMTDSKGRQPPRLPRLQH